MISARRTYRTYGIVSRGARKRLKRDNPRLTDKQINEAAKKKQKRDENWLREQLGKVKKIGLGFPKCILPITETVVDGGQRIRFDWTPGNALCRAGMGKINKILTETKSRAHKASTDKFTKITKEQFLDFLQERWLLRSRTFRSNNNLLIEQRKKGSRKSGRDLETKFEAFLKKYLSDLKRFIKNRFVLVDGKIYMKPSKDKVIEAMPDITVDPDNQCYDKRFDQLIIYKDCDCAFEDGGVKCEYLHEDKFPKRPGEPPEGQIRLKIYYNLATQKIRLIPDRDNYSAPKGFKPITVPMLMRLLSRHKDKGGKLLLEFLKLEETRMLATETSPIFRTKDESFAVNMPVAKYLVYFNQHLGKGVEWRKVVGAGVRLTQQEAEALVRIINNAPELRLNRHQLPIRVDNFLMRNKEEKNGVVTHEYHFPYDEMFLEKLETFIKSKYVEQETIVTEKVHVPWYAPWRPGYKMTTRGTGKYSSTIDDVEANTLKTLINRIGDWLIRRKRGKKSIALAEDGAVRQGDAIEHGKDTAKTQLTLAYVTTALFGTMLLTSMFGPDRVRKFPRWIMYNVFGRIIPGIRAAIRWADRRAIINNQMIDVREAAESKGNGPVNINAFPRDLLDDIRAARKARKSFVVHAYNGWGKTALKEALSMNDPDIRMLEVVQGNVDATEDAKYVSVIKRQWLRLIAPFKGRQERIVVEEASQFAGSGTSTGSKGIGTAIKGDIASDMNPNHKRTAVFEMMLTTAEFEESRPQDPAFWDRFIILDASRYGDVNVLKVLEAKQEWAGRITASYSEAIRVTNDAIVELRDLIVNKYPFKLTKTTVSPTRIAVKNLEAIIRFVREGDHSNAPHKIRETIASRTVTSKVVDYYYTSQMENAPPIMRNREGEMIPSPDYSKALPEATVVPALLKLNPNASEIAVEFATRIDASRFGNDPQRVAEIARRLAKIAPADLTEVLINKFMVDNIDRVSPLSRRQLKAAGLGIGESYLVRYVANHLNPADYNGDHAALLVRAREISATEDRQLIDKEIAHELKDAKKPRTRSKLPKLPKGGSGGSGGGGAAGTGEGVARDRRSAPKAPSLRRQAHHPKPESTIITQQKYEQQLARALAEGWRIDPTAAAVMALQRGTGARGPQAVSFHHMSPDAVGRMVRGQIKGHNRSSHLMVGGRINPYALAGLRQGIRRTIFQNFMIRTGLGTRSAARSRRAEVRRRRGPARRAMTMIPVKR